MTVKKHYTNKNYSAFSKRPVKVALQTFAYRPERYRMERLTKRLKTTRELVQYFVSNFALETSDFLYQPEEYGDASYSKWIRYKESLSYNLRNEIQFLIDYMEDNEKSIFDLTSGKSPILLNFHLSSKISIQTLVILDHFYNFLQSWCEADTLNSLYSSHAERVMKTKGFIKFDIDSVTTIVRGLEKITYEYEPTI